MEWSGKGVELSMTHRRTYVSYHLRINDNPQKGIEEVVSFHRWLLDQNCYFDWIQEPERTVIVAPNEVVAVEMALLWSERYSFEILNA
jgi:hypothetical protein